MDARLALLLALLSGTVRPGRCLEAGSVSKETLAEELDGYPEGLAGLLQESEEHVPRPLTNERLAGALLRPLLHTLQRPGRSPSFLFQPQRFGRETQGSWGNEGRLSQRGWESRASPFWSMAVPQRFGKK